MPRVREESWTGSEHQRRPQRPCSTNGYRPCLRPPRYVIKAGTPVKVRDIREKYGKWRSYVTKRTLAFDKPRYRIGRRELVFHKAGYAIRIEDYLCIQ
jgi:hypothetical protein